MSDYDIDAMSDGEVYFDAMSDYDIGAMSDGEVYFDAMSDYDIDAMSDGEVYFDAMSDDIPEDMDSMSFEKLESVCYMTINRVNSVIKGVFTCLVKLEIKEDDSINKQFYVTWLNEVIAYSMSKLRAITDLDTNMYGNALAADIENIKTRASWCLDDYDNLIIFSTGGPYQEFMFQIDERLAMIFSHMRDGIIQLPTRLKPVITRRKRLTTPVGWR